MNTRDDDICNQELFAPIATIYSVENISDAISFAIRTKYGLSAYLFTEDINKAIAVSESLEFGMVGINRGIMADPAAPFGGIKSSGIGREGGQDGIFEFLEPQYLALTVNDGVVN
jgi:succinate-semialdehyde dehydrogenase/glutarate-semialdehyde dehydrogenase